jgi:GNAT superfamily N-acetyltransferase
MGAIMDSNSPFEKRPALESFDSDETPGAAEIVASLGAEIEARFAPRDETPLAILARDGTGALLGGLEGVSHWRWLYVRRLWVAPAQRGRGLGGRLLEEAEARARARGCVGVYIDTFDASAAAFYERRGFARVGAIADFPPGHERIFLSKRLAAG